MTKQFKYPCAVLTTNLTEEQGEEVKEVFVKLGARFWERFKSYHKYYGVESGGKTFALDYRSSYSEKGDEDEVTIYTYDEIMSFVKELETPTQPLSDSWIKNTGEEPKYLLDGGKIDVKFNDGLVLTGVTDKNRGGEGDSDYAAISWRVGGSHVNIHSWKPSVASSDVATDTLTIKEYPITLEEESLPENSAGAYVAIEVTLVLDGLSIKTDRDTAFKVYEDLKEIFKEKIV